jgi:hypothetical protein
MFTRVENLCGIGLSQPEKKFILPALLNAFYFALSLSLSLYLSLQNDSKERRRERKRERER